MDKLSLPPIVEVTLTGKNLPDWLREPRRAEVAVNRDRASATFSASWIVVDAGRYYPDTAHIADPETRRKICEFAFSLDRPDCDHDSVIQFHGYIKPRL